MCHPWFYHVRTCLQHEIASLKPGGRYGTVLDERVLFRTNETAFVQTKRKLLEDCDLWCIVSLPGGVFTAAGAGAKTNLLFFTKGRPTESVWYYDLSDIKVGKKTPFTLDKFTDFFRLLPERADSERSWTLTRAVSVRWILATNRAGRPAVRWRVVYGVSASQCPPSFAWRS
jgi:type I restriction enzyme M protein